MEVSHEDLVERVWVWVWVLGVWVMWERREAEGGEVGVGCRVDHFNNTMLNNQYC